MEKVKLNELFTIRKGKKAQESSEGKFNYITIENLHSKTYSQKTDDIGVQVDFKDILIAWDGANAGLVGTKFTGVIGSTLAQLKLKDQYLNNVDTYYIFRYLDSKFEFIKSKRTGATIPHVNGDELRGMHIPLPDLATQKAIAAKLDKADEIRQLNKKIIEQYDALTQSLFLDMFGDPVKNEKGWEKGQIRDLCSSVKYGTSEKASSEGKYPYLRMNNITYEGYIETSDLKYINIKDEDFEKYSVKVGDILFNRTNSKELVGKTGLIKHEKNYIIAGYLIRVRTNELANPYFIWAYLNTKWMKESLRNMCKNIVGMANINAQELQNIPIYVPPITLQNQFAERVKAIEAQKALAQQALQQSEDLFNSLLQESFK